MRISDWRSDVGSSYLLSLVGGASRGVEAAPAAAEADARGPAARHADPARDLRRRNLSGQPVRRHLLRHLAAQGSLTLLKLADRLNQMPLGKIGRASCRARACPYV